VELLLFRGQGGYEPLAIRQLLQVRWDGVGGTFAEGVEFCDGLVATLS
jgi:hypothetical protein